MSVDLNLGRVKPEVACAMLQTLGYVLSEHKSEVSESHIAQSVFRETFASWHFEKGAQKVTVVWQGYEQEGVIVRTDANLSLTACD